MYGTADRHSSFRINKAFIHSTNTQNRNEKRQNKGFQGFIDVSFCDVEAGTSAVGEKVPDSNTNRG